MKNGKRVGWTLDRAKTHKYMYNNNFEIVSTFMVFNDRNNYMKDLIEISQKCDHNEKNKRKFFDLIRNENVIQSNGFVEIFAFYA